ncbi:MAG: hypothetical protein K2M91_15510, partial [Lachnospiraceae bacterium]|nr:hypothetical protein [Lachnospiraceae bacterium]
MDKFEYKVRSDEITKLIQIEKYAEAVKIADTIDWRRVKSATMLLRIAALYRINRRNEDSKEMLMLAYERYPANRSVLSALCELSIELDDIVAAVEYYKQFVKLAPKDNGVYTLRYRILEAQEASLEERIEILEELKKRDYQEEWAYELAYLYHRVGLSTKCVEECDDIILWFGDGPYVMKAMELKAMHVPLTDTQQQNYNIMLNNAGINYSGESDDAENTEQYDDEQYIVDVPDNSGYGAGNYNEDFYEENYSEEAYNENYNVESYDGQNYDTKSYDGQNYNTESYDGQNYDDNYGASGYDEQGYDTGSYGAVNGSGEPYADDGYGQESYPIDPYAEDNYGNNADNGYDNEAYADINYGQEDYSDGQNNYVDDGYGNLSYADGSYQDNSYTGEFYVDQMYDENGNLISPENYTNQDYPQDSSYQDNSYMVQPNASGQYRNGLHLVENKSLPSKNSGDMSQYNTINLQKVVAESMKELFPDDNDDVFAEDREKYNSSEDIGSITERNTRIFAKMASLDAAKKKTDDVQSIEEPSNYSAQTNRVAQMVTNVSETVPEPNTGAIRKVLVPGDDARQIKSESDIEELRDITERTVDDEHNRMESNDENVYHEKSLLDMNDDASKSQKTGPMNLDDVLVEWERIKQDNAKKYQEEIKQRVLTQTGKIFADFDNSIKSGILGELEREEEEARKSSSSARKERFLEADATNNIQQTPASDGEFEVEYITDVDKNEENIDLKDTENTAEYVEPEKGEADIKDAYLEMLERVTSRNIGVTNDKIVPNKDIQEINVNNVSETTEHEMNTYASETYADDAALNTEYETDAYIPKADDETAQQYETDESAPEAYTEDRADDETATYVQEINTENAAEYETGEYISETYAEDTADYESAEYNQEIYTEDSSGYTSDEYTQEIPATDEYTQEIYAEDAIDYETYAEDTSYSQEDTVEYADTSYAESTGYNQENEPYNHKKVYSEKVYNEPNIIRRHQQYQYNERALDPEDAASIAEMAKEDALKTQEIKMNTADLSSLSEKIVATTKKEAKGAKREEVREFTPDEQTLFENFAVTKKIKKQIIHALDNMTLTAYTGNVIITGDAGLDTVRMAKNLVKVYQTTDEYFSGKLAKISGEKINQRNIKDVFEKLNNGGIIIE